MTQWLIMRFFDQGYYSPMTLLYYSKSHYHQTLYVEPKDFTEGIVKGRLGCAGSTQIDYEELKTQIAYYKTT